MCTFATTNRVLLYPLTSRRTPQNIFCLRFRGPGRPRLNTPSAVSFGYGPTVRTSGGGSRDPTVSPPRLGVYLHGPRDGEYLCRRPDPLGPQGPVTVLGKPTKMVGPRFRPPSRQGDPPTADPGVGGSGASTLSLSGRLGNPFRCPYSPRWIGSSFKDAPNFLNSVSIKGRGPGRGLGSRN